MRECPWPSRVQGANIRRERRWLPAAPAVQHERHLTPVAIEAKLRHLVNDLARAQAALRQTRDLEVDARHEHDRARRRALLRAKTFAACPVAAGRWSWGQP